MKYKKGAIEIQFNWLFVLIIGAVILIVFSGIILRQKNISETSKNVLILNNLDAILSGSEVSAGTVNIVRIPKTTIEFKCNRYSIGGLSKQLEVMNVFPSSFFEGDRLISMALDFSIPYRITNLIYLTSPKYRYIFIGDDKARQIKDMMPNETFTDFYPALADVEYKGEKKVRFIVFGNLIKDGDDISPVLSDYMKLSDNSVTALNVKDNLESGNLEFFKKQGNKFIFVGTSSYLGKETLLGAVFSDSHAVYNCVMKNVFEKIGIVTQIYIKKIMSIRERYQATSDRCYDYKDTLYGSGHLSQISDASLDFTLQNSKEIIDASKSIENQNRQAQL